MEDDENLIPEDREFLQRARTFAFERWRRTVTWWEVAPLHPPSRISAKPSKRCEEEAFLSVRWQLRARSEESVGDLSRLAYDAVAAIAEEYAGFDGGDWRDSRICGSMPEMPIAEEDESRAGGAEGGQSSCLVM